MTHEGTIYAGYGRVVSRRRLLKQVAATGVGLSMAALVGCGSDETPSSTSTAPGTGAPAAPAVVTEEQKRGGYLRYVMSTGYAGTNIDPYWSDLAGAVLIGKHMYESLINVDFKNEEWRYPYSLAPWLAERWEQPDKTTYLMSIRQGVKFHNGATLSAQDVRFTYERALSTKAQTNNLARNLASLDIVGVQTVKVVAKATDAEFLENFSAGIGQVAIMSKTAGDAGVDFSKIFVGTGPFKTDNYRADSAWHATRFNDYWQKGRPYLDGIKFLAADDATLSASFIAGDNDILVRNDRVQAEPILKAVPDSVVSKWPTDFIYGIAFNASRTPFSDLRVRRAIHLALNRDAVDAAANFGDGQISGPLGIERSGYSLTKTELLALPGYRKPKDADLAEAVKLLEAAGYKGGFKGEIMFPTNQAVAPVYAEAIQGQLRKAPLGVDLKIVPQDSPTFTKRRSAGDFDTHTISQAGGVYKPGNQASVWHSTSPNSKAAGINDKELDALIDAAKVEFDIKARGEIFKKIELRLIDQAYYAAVSAPALTRMSRPWVRDWRDNRAQRGAIMNPDFLWMDMTKAPASRKSV